VTTQIRITGTITEIERKDGTNSRGDWSIWRFNVQQTNGEKHWYSWPNSNAGANLRTGKTYCITFATAPNPSNADHPYRNIVTADQVDTAELAPQEQSAMAEAGESQASRRPQPSGDFNTGMAFNQACALTAAFMSLEPNAEWSAGRVIACVQTLRSRLYHEVLMQPIDATDSHGEPDSGASEPEEPLFDEEERMGNVVTAPGDSYCPMHPSEFVGHDLFEKGKMVGTCRRGEQ